MEEYAKQLSELLRLLANEKRLLILCALLKQPLTVNQIAEFVPGITQPGVSQHLQLMRTAGILAYEKSAQSVTYSIADERIIKVMKVLRDNYCAT